MIDKYFFRRYLTPRKILRYLGAKEVLTINGHVAVRDKLYYFFDSVIGKEIYYFNQFEPELKKIFSRYIRPGDTILDIGANIGYHTIEFSKLVGTKGKVVAFEPFSTNFKVLELNCQRMPNVSLQNKALGKRVGKIKLREYEDTAYVSEYDIERANFVGRVENVPCTTVDAHLKGKKVDFIKVDVEGGELEVLKGAKQTLSIHHPVVVCEISVDNLKSQKISPNEILKYLIKLGYKSWGISKEAFLLPITKEVFAKTFNFLFVYER